MVRISTIMAAGVVVLGLSACGDSSDSGENLAEEVIEEGGDGDVDIEFDELPADFPTDDVPLPEAAK
jgi:hypothetical protein